MLRKSLPNIPKIKALDSKLADSTKAKKDFGLQDFPYSDIGPTNNGETLFTIKPRAEFPPQNQALDSDTQEVSNAFSSNSNNTNKPKTFNSSLEFDLLRSENSLDQKEIEREIQILQKKKLLQEREIAKNQKRQARKQKWENFLKPFKSIWKVVFSILKGVYWSVVFVLMVIQEIWEIVTYFFKPRRYK